MSKVCVTATEEPLNPLNVFDKNGRAIQVGDLLRVYHFQAAKRRQHFYLYKIAEGVQHQEGWRYEHLRLREATGNPLDPERHTYLMAIDGKKKSEYEVIDSRYKT